MKKIFNLFLSIGLIFSVFTLFIFKIEAKEDIVTNQLDSLSSDIEGKGEIYDQYKVKTFSELYQLFTDWDDIVYSGHAKRFITLEDDIIYTEDDNDKILQLSNITNSSNRYFSTEIFLDINGHNLYRTGRTLDEYIFHIKDGGKLVVYDSVGGGLISTKNNNDNKNSVFRTSGTTSKLILINVDVTFEVNTAINHSNSACVRNNGGYVYIYGGTFSGDDNSLSATMGETYIYGGTFLRQEESTVDEDTSHFNIGDTVYIEDNPIITSNGAAIEISGASKISPIEITNTKPHIAAYATRDATSVGLDAYANRHVIALSDTDNISWKLNNTSLKIEEHTDVFNGINNNILHITDDYEQLGCLLTNAKLYACSTLGDNSVEEFVATLDGAKHNYSHYVELDQEYDQCILCGDITNNKSHLYSTSAGYGEDGFYNIIVGDSPLYKDKEMPEGVSYSFDTETKVGTLTLNNYHYNGDGVRVCSQSGNNPQYAAIGIYVNKLKLVLKGNSEITLSDKYKSRGILSEQVDGELIIEGDGSLTINGGENSVDGIEFYASGAEVIQNGGNITINNFRYGISNYKLLQINAGSLTLNGNGASNSMGTIAIGNGENLVVNGGNLEIKNFANTVYCANGANFIYNSGKFILDARDVQGAKVFAGQFNTDTWPEIASKVYYQGNFSGDTEIRLDYFSDELNISKYTYVENLVEYDIYVGGIRIDESNQDDLFGDGKVSYNPITNTLTLNNYSFTGKGYIYDNDGPEIDVAACIYAEQDLIINLIGENHINPAPDYADEEAELSGIEISNSSTLTFKGTGSLIMDSNYVSIYAYNIIIKSGTFNIKGWTSLAGYESVSIEGGQLLLTASERATPYGKLILSNYKGQYVLIVSRNTDGSSPEDFTGDHFQVIYLKYISLTPKASYNITINSNNGTDVTADDISYGEYILPDNPFEAIAHYHFVGWSLDVAGDIIEDEKITVTEDTTIYAIWAKDTYVISFAHSQGAQGEMEDVSKEYGSSFEIPNPSFTPLDGKVFKYWTIDGVELTNKNITIEKDITLVAVYEDTPIYLTSITLSGDYLTKFNVGDTFNKLGLIVTAHYEGKEDSVVTMYEIDKSEVDMENEGTYQITISYTENGITKSASYNIEVKKESANNDNKKSAGLGAGAIIGIIIGSIAAIGLIGFVLYWFILRKKK